MVARMAGAPEIFIALQSKEVECAKEKKEEGEKRKVICLIQNSEQIFLCILCFPLFHFSFSENPVTADGKCLTKF